MRLRQSELMKLWLQNRDEYHTELYRFSEMQKFDADR